MNFKRKLRVLSLFSGIGAFESALEYLGIDFEIVYFSEIDDSAARAYSALHNVPLCKNLGDISNINFTFLPRDIDIVFYGFPCQDLSLAGLQKGFTNENGFLTRSGLVYYALNIINFIHPKVAICENVKNLCSKRFNKEFFSILDFLNLSGYNNNFKILNSIDFGIPQFRERLFIVSILKYFDLHSFNFPLPLPLKTNAMNFLESDVDSKYFLSDSMKRYIFSFSGSYGLNSKFSVNNSICRTINTRPRSYRAFINNYIAPCFDNDTVVPFSSSLFYSIICSPVRSLTPLECFRLMGFSDFQFSQLQLLNFSDTQLYKFAGNSIVVNVLCALFLSIFKSVLF